MAKPKAGGKWSGAGGDWSDTGTFVRKPATGWIHRSEDLVDGSEIRYRVTYLGCIPISQSMRSLQYNTRTAVTKEAIIQLAEKSERIIPNRKRKVGKQVTKLLGAINTRHAADVTLHITVDYLKVTNNVSRQTVYKHSLTVISFASGGEGVTEDFIAYVGKTSTNERACHVFQCSEGTAPLVLATVGQAFELRFKQYLTGGADSRSTPDHDAPETPECVQRSLPPLPPLPSEQDENPYYSAVPVEPTGRDDADYSYCALDEGEYSQPCLPADMQQYETAVDSLAELQLQTKQLPVATKQLPAVPPPLTEVKSHPIERPRVYSELPGFPQVEVPKARLSYNPYDTMNLTDGVPTLPPPPPLPEPLDEPESTLPPPIPSRCAPSLPHGTSPPLPPAPSLSAAPLPPVPSYGSAAPLPPVPSYGSAAPVPSYGSAAPLPPVPSYGSAAPLPPVPSYGSAAPVPSYGSAAPLPPVPSYGSAAPVPSYGSAAPLPPVPSESLQGDQEYELVMIHQQPTNKQFEDEIDLTPSERQIYSNTHLTPDTSRKPPPPPKPRVNRTKDYEDPDSLGRLPSKPKAPASDYEDPDLILNASLDETSAAAGPEFDDPDYDTYNPHPPSQHQQVDPLAPLPMQLYYHGRISRSAAESLVQIDGDYLVRESTNKSGQYVLTGRSSGTAQHLLLIDKNGRVKSRDREFDSIPHLVQHFSDNGLSLIINGHDVYLSAPVHRNS